MRDARIRLVRIGAALVAITVVLLVALHLAQSARDTSGSHALTAGALGTHTVAATPDVVPGATVLECRQTADGDRIRVIAYVLIPESADRARIESTLRKLAEHVRRDHPSASAIRILGYTSMSQRQEVGENAPWALVWSPDGLGWNGTSQDDFRQHVYCSAAE